MKKRCTNSACRRYFYNVGACPYCGKEYPRIGGIYDLVLLDYKDNKIKTIRCVREFTGLGLKEGKLLVEQAPVVVAEDVGYSEAIREARALELIGARAMVRRRSGRRS